MEEPRFTAFAIADVSARHIRKTDGELIGRKEAPGHIASIDPHEGAADSPGEIFAVLLDQATHEEQIADLKAFGFSEDFLNIWRALFRQKIPYVRFDADGNEAEGLPEFEW